MASPSNPMKTMDEEMPLSVTGYVHQFETSKSLVVPKGIILIICKYLKAVSFCWNRQFATKHVQFISNDGAQTVKFSAFGIIVGDIVISKKMLKKYSYSISIDKVGNNSLFYGFVASPFQQSIGDWNTYYCVGGNAPPVFRKKQYQLEVWHRDHELCAYGGTYDHGGLGGWKLFDDKRYKLKDGDILRCEADLDKAIIAFSIGNHKVSHTNVAAELVPSICAPWGTQISLHDFDGQLR